LNGDEIEQIDRRVIYGGKVSYRIVRHLGPVSFDTTIGGETRNDDIHVELWHTAQRQQLGAIRNDDVHESLLAAFINEEVTPAKWLRLDLGGRVDLLSFAVDSHLDTGGRRGSPSVEPQDKPGGDSHRFPKGHTGFLSQFRSRLPFQRRARRLRPTLGHASHPRRGRGNRHARAPVGPLGSGGCPVAARP